MQLARFLNSVFKNDGFILVDAQSKNYIIGSPKSDKPIKVKILDKKPMGLGVCVRVASPAM